MDYVELPDADVPRSEWTKAQLKREFEIRWLTRMQVSSRNCGRPPDEFIEELEATMDAAVDFYRRRPYPLEREYYESR